MMINMSMSMTAQTYNKDLEKSAKSGNVEAQRNLGICYFNGNGVKQSDKLAYEWLLKAAGSNDAEANFYLGKMYEEERVKVGGLIRIKGEDAKTIAFSSFMSAAQLGYAEAQIKIYHLYKNSDKEEAERWLNEAFKNGNAEAIYICAMQKTVSGEKYELLKQSAGKGYVPAQEALESAKVSADEEKNKVKPYRNIEVKKPNTILSILPMDILPIIDSLTIKGILNENDLAVIKSCTSLKYLDLTHCYTTLSEKEQKERNEEKAFLHSMFSLMGKVSDAKYKNGEISVSDNLYVQMFSELGKDKYQVKEGNKGCLIPAGAFMEMKNLVTVKLPYLATIIEGRAFMKCENLKYVEFPLYLEDIYGRAFKECTALENIEFPTSLKSMNKDTFDNCTSLKKVDLSKCIFESGYWNTYFNECTSLKEMHFPEGITVIGNQTFNANHRENDKWVSPECFYPKSLKKLSCGPFNTTVHFKSQEAPNIGGGQIRNCTVYVPKGSLTSYYAQLKDYNNTIKEE